MTADDNLQDWILRKQKAAEEGMNTGGGYLQSLSGNAGYSTACQEILDKLSKMGGPQIVYHPPKESPLMPAITLMNALSALVLAFSAGLGWALSSWVVGKLLK